MCKGSFSEKTELRIKGVKYKSYSKTREQCAKLLAVCFAVFTLASCGGKTGNSMFQTSENATNVYRSYLSEVRNIGTISTERLIESVNEWQVLRDSVYACIAKDTTNRPHQNHENTVRILHDSLRIEFTRLALSQSRSFADVFAHQRKDFPISTRHRTGPSGNICRTILPVIGLSSTVSRECETNRVNLPIFSCPYSEIRNRLQRQDVSLYTRGRPAVSFFPESSSGACRYRPVCHY